MRVRVPVIFEVSDEDAARRLLDSLRPSHLANDIGVRCIQIARSEVQVETWVPLDEVGR